MKILQLNVWTGRVKRPLREFLRNNDFDVICMQEAVWSNQDDMLENFFVTVRQMEEDSGLHNKSEGSNWMMRVMTDEGIMRQGNIILTKEKIVEETVDYVYGNNELVKSLEDFRDHGYTVQIVKLESGLYIVNYHGYYLPQPLGDENTVKVMKRVAKWVRGLDGPVVMCGDLNVTHESPAMRELDFLHDLTSEHGIKSTLTELNYGINIACDHILVSDNVKVKNFKVLPDIISDHKPLVVEIDY